MNTISKIFERHVCTQLYEFLNNKKLLHIAQSGFRQGHSCQTALTKLIDEWLKYLDNGEIVGTVFLDFSKAFDLINHAILLEKLKFYHIGKHIIDWIKSYLSDRQQEVQYANMKSDKSFVKYGVPQGSILCPLLFLIYRIGPKFLKLSAEIISPSLTFLINKKYNFKSFSAKIKTCKSNCYT